MLLCYCKRRHSGELNYFQFYRYILNLNFYFINIISPRSILLGSRGLDLLHMSHRLESLSAAGNLEPIGGTTQDSDLASFLRNERHNAIIAAVENTKKQVH